MIANDFIVGKYYRFINPTIDNEIPLLWTSDMEFMNDGLYHRLLSVNEDKDLLAFEGQLDPTISYNYINSSTISCIDHWEKKQPEMVECKLTRDFKNNGLMYNSVLGLWVVDDYNDTAGTRYLDLYSEIELKSFNRLEVFSGIDQDSITEFDYVTLDLLPRTSLRSYISTVVRLDSFSPYVVLKEQPPIYN